MYQLAMLLMELDRDDEVSSLLGADALYRLGRLEDAHKALLLALSRRPQAAPVLVRLALLQLRRGFFYDANQVRRPRGGGTVWQGGWATPLWRAQASGPLTLHPSATSEQVKLVPALGSATCRKAPSPPWPSVSVCVPRNSWTRYPRAQQVSGMQ